uniref:Uncharacterized protein n=1 Tax=Anguilla anguilla TaxID=7936 RepID=A0A0E9SRI1_ANGAN
MQKSLFHFLFLFFLFYVFGLIHAFCPRCLVSCHSWVSRHINEPN